MRLNQNMSRKIVAVAMVAATAATLSVGAFAAEDDGVIAGYLPPQEQMVQGNIALHGAESTTPVVDETYGGYGAPEGDPIQGDIMLISADVPVETAEEQKVPVAAGLTMTGLFRKSVLFTARQDGQVLTLAAPEDNTVVRGTIGDLRAQMQQGVGTLCVMTNKKTTTLNLTLMCDGYSDNTHFTLRTVGDRAYLTIGLRSRRDLLIGR